MNNQDYKSKKRECWEEFCKEHPLDVTANGGVAFRFAFERAYALGKQEKNKEKPGYGQTIKGWAACDKDGMLRLHYDKPERTDGGYWQGGFKSSYLPTAVVLPIVWESDPIEVDVTIKPHLSSDAGGEPKFHVEDWVKVVSIDKHGHIGQIIEVEYEYGCNYYRVSGAEGWYFLEKNLEPYTEPEKNHIPNPAKIVDDILKDGFHEHNRLHVAAMAMQGMLSNTTRFSSYEISDLVRISLNCADALLAECESSAQSLCHAKKGGPK